MAKKTSAASPEPKKKGEQLKLKPFDRKLFFGVMAVCLFVAGCGSEQSKTEAENKTEGKTESPSDESSATDQRANIATTMQTIDEVLNASRTFAINHDAEWPQSLEDLTAPEVIDGEEKRPYLDKTPTDAWGTPIHYEPPDAANEEPLILSFGANKKEGGGDDISNQDVETERSNPKKTTAQ